MNRIYWLLLSSAAAVTVMPVACSPQFRACENCPSQGGGGGVGGAGSAEHTAGDTFGPGDAGSGVGDAGSGGEGGEGVEEAVLFGPCSKLGQTACSGHAAAQRLGCDGSKWLAGLTCTAGELCDSASGGCAKVVPECVGGGAGDVVCRGDVLLSCGLDLVTALEGETCVGLCKDGACQTPVCGDEKIEPGEECDDGKSTSGACVKCKTAVCGDGLVYPDHEQCDDANLISGDGCSATCRVETVAIALGGGTTCALSSAGQVKCWGRNESGVLGLGDTKNRGDIKSQVPSKLPVIDLGTDRTAIAITVSGANSACALLDHGEVKCWGNNQFGQLGTGSKDNRGDDPGEMGDALRPVPLGAGRKAIGVSAGHNYTCAVLDDGDVECWGSGEHGQLGLESVGDVVFPDQFAPIDLKRPAKAVSASDGVTCALLDIGTVKCWGSTIYLPLSDSANIDSSDGVGDYPGEISGLSELTFGGGKAQVIVAGQVSGAMLDNGSLMLWGYGYQGWTHAGLPPDEFTALPAMNLGAGRKVKSSDVDVYHACAITDDGTLSCWGYAPHGALGLGSAVSSSAPVKVDLGGRAAVQVAVAEEHSCAILDDGALKCWGYNASGQLGLGDAQTRGNSGDKLSADTTVDLSF